MLEQIGANLTSEFCQSILDHLPGYFYVLDLQQRFVWMNRAAAEVAGYGPDKVMCTTGTNPE